MTIPHLASALPCSQCNKPPAFPLLIEWSTPDTIEDPGCVAETFCSWVCAARWFCDQAGIVTPATAR